MTEIRTTPVSAPVGLATDDWPARFVADGFGVANLLERDFCAQLVAEIGRLIGDTRPPGSWTRTAPGQIYSVIYAGRSAVLDRIYRHPGLRDALGRLFGANGFLLAPEDGGEADKRHVALWLNPYDAAARPILQPMGHIDSGNPYRGVAILVSLLDTEPFSGNTTFFPRSHVGVHAAQRQAGERSFPGGNYLAVARPERPVEFVARAGDVAFVHHCLCHSGNPSHSAHRRPRLALRIEVFARRVPDTIDPDDPGLSPWAQSYAHHGRVAVVRDGLPAVD